MAPPPRPVTSPSDEQPLWDPTAIPAATVVVLRESTAGPEVLMVRRDRSLSFAGGMWVFPGGRIDPSDRIDPGDRRPPTSRPDGATSTTALGAPALGAPALDAPALGAPALDAPALDAATLELAARRAAVREAREEAGLALDEDGLVRWSHWTPPPESPKRFTTAFFVTALPAGAGEVVVDDGEIRDHRWSRPADVLDERDRGSTALSPPTFITLTQLAAHRDLATLLDAARSAPVEHFWTRICVDGDEVVALYHGDSGYESGLVSHDGPRHRLRMAARWTYERSP